MSKERNWTIGKDVKVTCARAQVMVNSQLRRVIVWYNPQTELVFDYEDLEYGTVPFCPNSVSMVLSKFETPFWATIIEERRYSIFEDGEVKRIHQYHLSRREYLKKKLKEIELGKIYSANITSIAKWGVFVEINGLFTALCHCTEVSKAMILELKSFFEIGEHLYVKVISKRMEEGFYRIEVSRKQAASPVEYCLGERVRATIASRLDEDSYFCEVTPCQKGIYHTVEDLRVGDTVYGVLTKIEPEGYRLRKIGIKWW